MKYTEWKRLITSDNPSDRAEAADDVPIDESGTVVPYLLICLNDESSLVRACAVDSLRLFPTNEVRVEVWKMINNETDNLAKAYAYSTIGSMGNIEDLTKFSELLKKESNPLLRIHLTTAMILCSMHIWCEEMSSLGGHKELQVRISSGNGILHVLEEFTNSVKKLGNELLIHQEKVSEASNREVLDNVLKLIKNFP